VKATALLHEAGGLVRFSHTVFALPFAVMAAFAAARGLPPPPVLAWILAAMVGARTAAMAFNRLADHAIDARNPRTAGRHLPSARVSRRFAWTLVGAGAALLTLAAWQLNPLCLALSPLALAWLLAYSYTKRFTSLSHLWLGISLGLAPIGAWIAVQGRPGVPPLLLGIGVTGWVGGFDVIYALQDEAFDRRLGLFSLPARLGSRRALLVARGFHVLAAAGFVAFAWSVGAGWGLWTGVAAALVLLVWQHSLVRPGRLERLDTAFFTANGALSIVMCLLYILDMMRLA
jgi:4-hydroxybenzoate polyprenyltransferase